MDSGVREGDSVGTFYDPMIAKIICRGPDRASALQGLGKALAQTQVGDGVAGPVRGVLMARGMRGSAGAGAGSDTGGRLGRCTDHRWWRGF